MSHTIRVIALLTQERERVVLEEKLTEATLPLLRHITPLSRALLDGAGQRYRPRGIAVYLDGKKLWERRTERHGETALCPVNHEDYEPILPTFTDVFGDECWPGYDAQGHQVDNDRLAANRAAYELLRNDPETAHWADDVAAELIEAAGSLRPKLRSTRPAPRKQQPITPDPCPVACPPKPVRDSSPADTESAMWAARYAARERQEWVDAAEGYRGLYRFRADN